MSVKVVKANQEGLYVTRNDFTMERINKKKAGHARLVALVLILVVVTLAGLFLTSYVGLFAKIFVTLVIVLAVLLLLANGFFNLSEQKLLNRHTEFISWEDFWSYSDRKVEYRQYAMQAVTAIESKDKFLDIIELILKTQDVLENAVQDYNKIPANEFEARQTFQKNYLNGIQRNIFSMFESLDDLSKQNFDRSASNKYHNAALPWRRGSTGNSVWPYVDQPSVGGFEKRTKEVPKSTWQECERSTSKQKKPFLK